MAWTNMFVPLGGALQLPVPRLKRWQQLTLTHQLNQRTHIFSSFHQKLPNIMWSSRCLLEVGTRTPSASAKAAVHHQILQHWGLRGVSGGLSTLGQGPAQCKSRSMWGTHNLFPKINPQQQKRIPLLFASVQPSSPRPTTSISFFVSFASELLGATRAIHSREERWAKVSPIFPDKTDIQVSLDS